MSQKCHTMLIVVNFIGEFVLTSFIEMSGVEQGVFF
jgi:hypothetical protein